MVHILWKSNAPHSPLQDHELVELRLVDLGSPDHPQYLVREIRAYWSSSAQQICWSGYKDHSYGTPQEAQNDFAQRKDSISCTGFRFTTVLG
jgi:hypothetical protein